MEKLWLRILPFLLISVGSSDNSDLTRAFAAGLGGLQLKLSSHEDKFQAG